MRKYKKQLLNTGLDATKKVVHYVGEFFGNTTADTVTKSSDDKIVKQEPVRRKKYSTRKRKWEIKAH